MDNAAADLQRQRDRMRRTAAQKVLVHRSHDSVATKLSLFALRPCDLGSYWVCRRPVQTLISMLIWTSCNKSSCLLAVRPQRWSSGYPRAPCPASLLLPQEILLPLLRLSSPLSARSGLPKVCNAWRVMFDRRDPEPLVLCIGFGDRFVFPGAQQSCNRN